MRRTIITPPDLASAALDELKGWLAITTSSEDQFLTGLLRAALETCEGFTGQVPLEVTAEEILPADAAWRGLATRPVQAVTGVEGIPAEGARFALAPEDYAVDLDAGGGGHVRLLRPQAQAGRRGASRCASSLAWRPTGRACPKACVTASSGSPPTGTASATASPPRHTRRLRSPRCGVRGAGCA